MIFDNAAAVDNDDPWLPMSIFPFRSRLGGDAGSGELAGLVDCGLVGDGNAKSFRLKLDLELVCCILKLNLNHIIIYHLEI